MTGGTLADYGITIDIQKTVPEPSATKFIVLQDAEWPDAISVAIQCRKTHPDEAVEIYPRDHGLFTVVRVVVN